MARKPKNPREALNRLDRELIEDILSTSDEKIVNELKEDGEDPSKIADHMRVLFATTELHVAKQKLAAAKQAVAEAKDSAKSVSLQDAKRRIADKMSKGGRLGTKLTLAARSGEGQSDRDLDSAIEDLAELGALDDEGPESP